MLWRVIFEYHSHLGHRRRMFKVAATSVAPAFNSAFYHDLYEAINNDKTDVTPDCITIDSVSVTRDYGKCSLIDTDSEEVTE